ncbi:unnamed protein product, partial [Closterium sp. NIES-54]
GGGGMSSDVALPRVAHQHAIPAHQRRLPHPPQHLPGNSIPTNSLPSLFRITMQSNCRLSLLSPGPVPSACSGDGWGRRPISKEEQQGVVPAGREWHVQGWKHLILSSRLSPHPPPPLLPSPLDAPPVTTMHVPPTPILASPVRCIATVPHVSPSARPYSSPAPFPLSLLFSQHPPTQPPVPTPST